MVCEVVNCRFVPILFRVQLSLRLYLGLDIADALVFCLRLAFVHAAHETSINCGKEACKGSSESE